MQSRAYSENLKACASRDDCQWELRDAVRSQFQVAPISTNLIFSYFAERLLGLPRSF